MSTIRQIYQYREMLYNLVRRDLRARYKASFLGFLWTFINPLMQLTIYSIVFPMLMRITQPNYTMFLFVVLLPWTAFQASVQGSASCIVGNANMIKKIYFPRIILPVSVVSVNLVNYFYCLIIAFISLIFTGIGIHLSILWLPIIVLILGIFSMGVSFIVSSLNVAFRDIEHIISIVLMAWFYATPVLYDLSMIPVKYHFIYKLNPMVGIIKSFRDIMFFGVTPNLKILSYDLVFSIILVVVGYFIFEKLSKSFAEEL